MRRWIRRPWLLALGLGALLGACGEPPDSNLEPKPAPAPLTPAGTEAVVALFDPSREVLPLPNDLVWQADGDPEVELAPGPGDAEELAQLKTLVNGLGLLGLSPNMFLTVPLSGGVDSRSLEVRLFRLDAAEAPRTEADFELLLSTVHREGASRTAASHPATSETADEVLKLVPHTPLVPGSRYAVAVKSTLGDEKGFPVVTTPVMNALKSREPFAEGSAFRPLEPVRAAFNEPGGLFDALEANFGWARSDVLLLWTFHTAGETLSLPDPGTGIPGMLAYEDFGAPLASFRGLSQLQWTDNALSWSAPDGSPTPGPVPAPASAVLGPLAIPHDALESVYFGAFDTPDLSLGGAQATAVPFVLITPAGTSPPFPTLVFQHGIGRTKEDAFALANALGRVGLAVLAPDAPFHGARAPGGTGSGELFLTANLLLDRLNVYQAATDLWEAFDVTGTVDLDGDGTADLEPAHFAAQSLGSIIGSAFASQEPRARGLLLANPSAQLANVLDETSLPDLGALVAGLGFARGTTEYYVFLNLAQWLLDPVDPAYTGIGDRSPADLLAPFAHGDPVVSPVSSVNFLIGVGAGPEILVNLDLVDVQDPSLGAFPSPSDLQGAGYRYGGVEEGESLTPVPVVHGFLLSPSIRDPDTGEIDPIYRGYDETVQQRATVGAQTQAAGFFNTH